MSHRSATAAFQGSPNGKSSFRPSLLRALHHAQGQLTQTNQRSVLFLAAMVGPVVLPLMLFHQIQLMACAYLARRFASRSGSADAKKESHPPLAA